MLKNRKLISRDGGGTAIILNSKFKSVRKIVIPLNIQPSTFELTVISLSTVLNVPGVIILLVYRPPQTSTNLFFNDFLSVIEFIVGILRQNKLLILGDFNIAINNHLSPISKNFMEILNILSLQNHIYSSTFKWIGKYFRFSNRSVYQSHS